jgi:hypothetical protein
MLTPLDLMQLVRGYVPVLFCFPAEILSLSLNLDAVGVTRQN